LAHFQIERNNSALLGIWRPTLIIKQLHTKRHNWNDEGGVGGEGRNYLHIAESDFAHCDWRRVEIHSSQSIDKRRDLKEKKGLQKKGSEARSRAAAIRDFRPFEPKTIMPHSHRKNR
jgi:hypothetical protein